MVLLVLNVARYTEARDELGQIFSLNSNVKAGSGPVIPAASDSA